jgi:hypothetical protein
MDGNDHPLPEAAEAASSLLSISFLGALSDTH